MERFETLNLFKDIQKVSDVYKNLQLKDVNKEIEDNKKLNSLLGFYKEKMDDITNRSNLLLKQTKDELKDKNFKDIHKILVDLNTFSLQKLKSVKGENIDSTTVMAVTHATVDELNLINESIRNKEYLNDKYTYFYIYEKVLLNAFITFLTLKEMDMNKKTISDLSQGIFTQLQTLAIISI